VIHVARLIQEVIVTQEARLMLVVQLEPNRPELLSEEIMYMPTETAMSIVELITVGSRGQTRAGLNSDLQLQVVYLVHQHPVYPVLQRLLCLVQLLPVQVLLIWTVSIRLVSGVHPGHRTSREAGQAAGLLVVEGGEEDKYHLIREL
jgi:hypothetical protein